MKMALTAALSVAAGAMLADKVGDVQFPSTWDFRGQTLVLNGAGMREYGVFGTDIYAAALYLREPMHDAETVLEHPGPKVLYMHLLRSASVEYT